MTAQPLNNAVACEENLNSIDELSCHAVGCIQSQAALPAIDWTKGLKAESLSAAGKNKRSRTNTERCPDCNGGEGKEEAGEKREKEEDRGVGEVGAGGGG